MVLGSGIRDPGSGIRKNPFRIPGSKRHRIPDPHHWRKARFRIRIDFKADPEFLIIADPDPGFWWPKKLKRLYSFNFLIKHCNLLILKGFLKIQQNNEVHFLENLRPFVAPLYNCLKEYLRRYRLWRGGCQPSGRSSDWRRRGDVWRTCLQNWMDLKK